MGRGRPIALLALDGAERETLEQWTRRPKTARRWPCGPESFWPVPMAGATLGWPPSCGYTLTRWGNGVPDSWNNGWTACWTNRAAVVPG